MTAQLMPGCLNRHEVPHVPFVAPRAQKKILLGYLGPFNRACRRRSRALVVYDCLHCFNDDVADGLDKPVGCVAHRCGLGSSVR
jgi:hypothetical protein